MKRYVQFPTEEGESIVVEVSVEDAGYGSVKAGRPGDVAERAEKTFEDALAALRPATNAVMNQLRDLHPDEATVEFGVKLDTKAGAFLASAGASANFKVTLKWASKTPASSSNSD